jgi:hypothetical protein
MLDRTRRLSAACWCDLVDSAPAAGKNDRSDADSVDLRGLDYVRKGQLVAVTRDDLVGPYIRTHDAEAQRRSSSARWAASFIDEAYLLYWPENERDYGQEAIEILLKVMENQRDDRLVIFAGYKDRMDRFFSSNFVTS